MGRVPRRRSVRPFALPIGAGVLLLALAWGLGWAVAVAHAEAPTVTFEGGPLAPAICPSAPDQPSLVVGDGTWVNIVNRTGAKATLEVDGAPGETIPKNGGLSVMLPPGRHELRLIPQCALHGTLVPVVVDVSMVLSAPTVEPSATPVASPPAGPPASGPPRPYRDGGPTGGRVTGPRGGGAVDGGVAASPTPSDPPVPGAAGPDDLSSTAGGPVFIPYAVPETEERHGAHLLAIIATICVFGVTVAIIRAILAQRTTRMVRL